MGFSVTAAYAIFAIALLAAFSAASGAYWQSQTHIEESRRTLEERVTEAAHTNLTITDVRWSNGPKEYEFTVRNKGSTVLDYTDFVYMFNGVPTFIAQTSPYPRLNGVNPSTSNLLAPGDTLECRFTLAAEPAKAQVVAENGFVVHYPG